MKFNKYQENAVNAFYGNIALIASAGSGKSSVLTHRTANMINSDIPSEDILCITFSKTATVNMQDKLKVLLKDKKLPTISTCHALGLNILKQFAATDIRNGLLNDYAQKMLIIDICMKRLKLFDKSSLVPVGSIRKFFDNQRLDLKGPDSDLELDFVKSNGLSPDDFQTIFKMYEAEKIMLKKVDFMDMLYKAYVLLRDNEDVRTFYQNKYHYVLVDEAQDCNLLQIELIRLINMENVFFVGDNFQCWEGNGLVRVKTQDEIKLKKVCELEVGDMVQTVRKRKVCYCKTTKIASSRKRTVKIYTAKGRILEVTRNHKCFSTQAMFENKYIYVYLMYKEDKGYRVGITSGGNSESLRCRINSERAEKMWLLRQFNNKIDATFYESYISLKYGVPTNPFESNGRGLSLNQIGLDKIFREFGMNGERLLKDLDLNFDYPNYDVRRYGANSKKINLSMNTKNGFDVFCECHGERTRRYFQNYKEAYKCAYELKESLSAVAVKEKFSFNKSYLDVVVASQIMIGMQVPVLQENGELELENVIEVENCNKEVEVFDIEVAEAGCLIVNDVLSHNSIYGFLKASPRFILEFKDFFPNAKYMNLPINYRCSKNIVDNANKLLYCTEEVSHESFLEPVANKDRYKEPVLNIYNDIKHEAKSIGQKCLDLVDSNEYDFKDIAVLMRANAQSAMIQSVFMQMEIPFEIIGGDNFFDRKEVKDMINYIKFIFNEDEEAFMSIYNSPSRYLGKVFIENFFKYKQKMGLGLITCLKAYERICDWKNKTGVNQLLEIVSRVKRRAGSNISDLILSVLEESNYGLYLKTEFDDDGRIENIMSLADQARSFKNIDSFLEAVDKAIELSQKQKKREKTGEEEDSVKVLTVHKSKGLEFPVVFVISMNEGLFPHKKADLQEERRLAYVAVTRAEKELYVSCTEKANDNECTPSCFIDEMFSKSKRKLSKPSKPSSGAIMDMVDIGEIADIVEADDGVFSSIAEVFGELLEVITD